MPTSYGGVLTNRDINIRPGQTQATIGDLNRPEIQSRDLNSDLEYSNRNIEGGRANNSYLSYAYTGADADSLNSDEAPLKGARSLFNDYAILVHPKTNDANQLFDGPDNEGVYPKYDIQNSSVGGIGGRDLRVEHLIQEHPPYGKVVREGESPKSPTPYYASDFIYAKNYKRIPLNHLITLRRFPFPTYDNLNFDGGQVFKPIAQAVTYFGENTGNDLEELSKFNGFINWEEMEADVNDVEGDERGTDETPFFDKLRGTSINARGVRVGGEQAAGAIKYGNAFANQGRDQIGGQAQDRQERAKLLSDPNYTNQVLGPVNVVKSTLIRGRGLGANWEVTLKFEYELRSFSGINPRVAMIDLLCNMLALCFNNAKFWGGANRYFPKINQFGFIGDQQKLYNGDYGGYIKSFVSQLGDGLSTGMSALKGLIGNILQGDMGSLGKSLGGAGSTLLAAESYNSRPSVIGFRALLTGLPIGEWHLTVGNPFRPFMMMGNLVVKDFEFFFSGPMSADDIPSNLTFNITLAQGRPRDKGDVESVMNLGEGRVYYPPVGLNSDVANMSASTGAVIKPDNGQNVGNQSKSSDLNTTSKPQLKPDNKNLARGGREDLEYIKKMSGSVF